MRLPYNRIFVFFDKVKGLEEYNQTLENDLIKILNHFFNSEIPHDSSPLTFNWNGKIFFSEYESIEVILYVLMIELTPCNSWFSGLKM